MKIESNDKSIEELLSSRFFTIPRFQRPYSWEPEQVVEFWSDITANFGEQYFIGSMVGFRIDKLSLGIVDGQQRLTTITLLLCSIRDAFKELEQTDAAIGTHTFIERTTKDNKKRYVLRTETSFPYLQEHILKDDEAELDEKIGSEEASLKRAFEIFLVKIRAKFVSIDRDSTIVKGDKFDEKISFLNELRDRVLALNVILVELEDEDDAYLIFETLNTRGKDLALSDLLKNHFNRLIKAKGDVDPPNEKWREVLELLEGAPTPIPVDNFIMHYWQSRYGFVSKAKVFKEAKQKIKSNNAKTELNSIVNDAKSYRKVFDTGFNWKKDQAKVTQSLKALYFFV